MRVLTVGNMYPPHHFGGYELAWQAAVAHLRDRGHEVRVLCTDFRHPQIADGDEPNVDRRLDWYWRDHEFVALRPVGRLRLERRNHRLLAGHLDDLRPDVVSFWSMGGMSHSLIEAVRRRGIPIASFVHDQWLDYGRFADRWTAQFARWRRPLAPVVERLTGLPARVDYDSAGRYVFVSEFIRRRQLALGLGISDTALASSGIHPAFVRGDAARRDPDWRWRLLVVGRLHPDKGTADAVQALTALPEATLTFAGTWDGRDERALTATMGDCGVAHRVTMLGHRDREQVAALYREHDAVLFPVRWDEPWGLVPLEAMASGCPVVATGRGGSGEYLRDEVNCLLVESSDPSALAGAVRRLAGDRALRRRLREGGARTAPQHTQAIYNAAVERHLLEVA